MNLTCEYCGRDRNDQNNTNWKRHVELCKTKNKRQKVNLDSFFFKKPKLSTCKYCPISV